MKTLTDSFMHQRTQRLAKPTVQVASSESFLTAVGFGLAGQSFAIEERYLTEVVRGTDITTIPGTPAFVRGVTLYRGSALAVFDLATLLKLPLPSSAGDNTYSLVLGDSTPEFAVSVGEIHRQVVLGRESIRHHADRVEANGGYTLGVTSDGLVILDGDRLLRDDTLRVDMAVSG